MKIDLTCACGRMMKATKSIFSSEIYVASDLIYTTKSNSKDNCQ
jgi:hypothetical protein